LAKLEAKRPAEPVRVTITRQIVGGGARRDSEALEVVQTVRRARLSRLEARQKDTPGDVIGFFEADLQAGVWREIEGGQGRTLPLSPEDFEKGGRLAESGGALLMLAPIHPAKVIVGVSWGDL